MTSEIVVVGYGNMGRALVAGWIASRIVTPGQIVVVEPGEDQRRHAQALGVTAVASFDEIADGAAPQLVLLAVKPQLLHKVVPRYASMAGLGTTFARIAAGTSIGVLEEMLGFDAPLVRIMPNTPALIGKGITAVCYKPNVAHETRELIVRLLGASGLVTEIPDETLMDAVTAVSGSGPAYIFHFIECLIVAAESVGLPPETAKLLAIQTAFGAAAMAAERKTEVGKLREQVTSQNGTTAAALQELMTDNRLQQLVKTAVTAARDRSLELGRKSPD